MWVVHSSPRLRREGWDGFELVAEAENLRKENFKIEERSLRCGHFVPQCRRDDRASDTRAKRARARRKAPAPRTPSGRGQRAGGPSFLWASQRYEIRKEQNTEKRTRQRHSPFADSAKSGAPEKSKSRPLQQDAAIGEVGSSVVACPCPSAEEQDSEQATHDLKR